MEGKSFTILYLISNGMILNRLLKALSITDEELCFLDIKNLKKCVVVPEGKWSMYNRIKKLRFYGFIADHPYWHVYFEKYTHALYLIREEALPTDDDDSKEEIRYKIVNDLPEQYYYYRLKRINE